MKPIKPISQEHIQALIKIYREQAQRQLDKGHHKAASIWTWCANDLQLLLKDDNLL